MSELVYGDEIYQNFEQFSSEDAVLFIDPLDATAEFVNGNICAVNVLLGLTVRGIPKIGIIHNPFSTNDPNSNSLTIFGT
jgi:fructose-1,6-bisphosphatase/inositol monophosphatase family enzyme